MMTSQANSHWLQCCSSRGVISFLYLYYIMNPFQSPLLYPLPLSYLKYNHANSILITYYTFLYNS